MLHLAVQGGSAQGLQRGNLIIMYICVLEIYCICEFVIFSSVGKIEL